MEGWGGSVDSVFCMSLTLKGRVTSAPLLSKASLKWRGGQFLGHRKGLLKTDHHLAMREHIPDRPSNPGHGLPHLPHKEISKKGHFQVFSPSGHHH